MGFQGSPTVLPIVWQKCITPLRRLETRHGGFQGLARCWAESSVMASSSSSSAWFR